MDVRVETVTAVKQRVTISVDPDRVGDSRKKMLGELRKRAQIKGFRAGKAPMSLIERYYGEHVQEELRNDLLQEALDQAVKEHSLRLVASPEIESSEFSEQGGFSATALVEVYPTIEPKDYFGLSVKRRLVSVNEKKVDERLAYLAGLRAQLQTVEEDRPAQKGDVVEIDYKGLLNGEPFEGGTDENYLLELGAGRFIPGFEDGLIGVRNGENRELPLRFPDDYGKAELAGKDVVFQVAVKAIKVRVVPELDDEFVKDLGAEYETLDQLREHEREMLRRDGENRARDFDRGQLVDALLAVNDFEVPETMVRKQLASMQEQTRHNLSYSGFQREQIDELMRESEERMRPDAIKEVKAVLLFDAIAEAEKIEVSEDDIQGYYQKMADTYHQPVAEIAAYYQKNQQVEGIRFRLLEDKTIDRLLERAEVEWVEEPVQAPEPAADSGSESDDEPAPYAE